MNFDVSGSTPYSTFPINGLRSKRRSSCIFQVVASEAFLLALSTPRSNVKRMRDYTEMAGKMSAKIIGVNTGKEKVYYKETAEDIK